MCFGVLGAEYIICLCLCVWRTCVRSAEMNWYCTLDPARDSYHKFIHNADDCGSHHSCLRCSTYELSILIRITIYFLSGNFLSHCTYFPEVISTLKGFFHTDGSQFSAKALLSMA